MSKHQIHYCLANTGQETLDTDKELADLLETVACPLCCNIPNRAKLLPCCSKHICSLCGVNWLKSKSSCPYCRTELKTDQIHNGLPDADEIQIKIDDLMVFCPFFDEGCDWVSKRAVLVPHIEKDCRVYNDDRDDDNQARLPLLSDFALKKEWVLPKSQISKRAYSIDLSEMNEIQSVLIEMVDLSRESSTLRRSHAEEEPVVVQRKTWLQILRNHCISFLIFACILSAFAVMFSIKFSK